MNTNKQFTRQIKFIAYYLDKGSATYSSALKSALKAGYGAAYARKITSHLNWEEMEKALESVQNELRRLFKIVL